MSEETNDNNDAEYFALMVRVCDGLGDEADCALLRKQLETDPEARALYLEYVNMHAQLQWQCRGVGKPHDLEELTQLIEAESELFIEIKRDGGRKIENASQERSHRQSKLMIHRKPSMRVPMKLVVAACLLVGLIPLVVAISISLSGSDEGGEVVVEDSQQVEIESIATVYLAPGAVVSRIGDESRQRVVYLNEDPMGKGAYIVELGRVTIEFESGVTVSLDAPAEIELISAMQMKMNEGEAMIVVSEEGYGFQAITPQMQVTDLGTSFGITVDRKSNDSELHVIQGEVELQTADAKSSFRAERVTTGQAKQVGVNGLAEQIEYQGVRYLNLVAGDEARVPMNRSYLGWVSYREKMKKNADALLFLDFEELEYGDENVLNHAPNRLQCVRHGSFDVSGRFSGKRALAFQEISDRIDFEIKRTLPSFTLSCWLGFDEIGNSALVMSDGFGLPGQQLRWQFHDNGDLRLTIMRDEHHVERFYAKEVITPSHFGRWIHLATTYDINHARVKHYVNGELVAEHEIEDAQPVKIGSASIGNWKNGNATRRFVGRIDEVLILEKALSEDEVTTLYQKGMPYGK